MIRLIQRKLIIPRGDSGSFAIPPIASSEDAIAVFAILDPSTNRKVFSKIIEDVAETINVSFTHDETVNLPCGKFLWDIKYYTEPIIVDGELIGGTEVDSYYAAYTMPECEVRQTADNLLTADGSPETTLTPDAIDAITAALNEIDSKMAEIEEISGHAPIIQNGEWYIWDTDTGDYIDSGVSATGPEGPQGETGPTGETGAPGPKGDPGEGVPTGGAEGDVLTKSGAADYSTEWAAPAVTAAQFAALQAQVDALYPTKSVGPTAVVAVDDALAGNAQGLTVAIEPVQDLNGYENPWPAGGGKNLLDFTEITPTYPGETAIIKQVNIPQDVTFQFTASSDYANSDNYWLVYVARQDNTRTYITPTAGQTVSRTITGTSENPITEVYIRNAGVTAGKVYNLQLEKGSSATAWTPYSNICPISGWTGANVYRGGADQSDPVTIPVSFAAAGTVYGGTRDVVTGEMVVDRAMVDFSGEDAWYAFSVGSQSASAICALSSPAYLPSALNAYNGAISSIGQENPRYWASARPNESPDKGNWSFALGGNFLRLYTTEISTITDLASFKAAVPSFQLCYTLATPTTYQLTPQQIALLRGNNTVWADTGDTTLTYKQDIALLLSKLDSTT